MPSSVLAVGSKDGPEPLWARSLPFAPITAGIPEDRL
eukprot:CAMPEP_0172699970 /NCGR_PEP_ID=MMETSP1074-20121228/30571_1 /TAXON_ID=2916 /ORGANISM="Ceratium fusus, Strain PA161109" /LENGTH=36 /DNA_ID= /DNA_START= /DNA_END= /DNA_ORIENTATION=